MLSLLISLIILCIILAVVYWILTMIPVPPPMVWIVRVVFALICLIAVLSLLLGGWTLPIGHPLVR